MAADIRWRCRWKIWSGDRIAELYLALHELAIKSSELTLRTAVLINGGAAISVLAFIGGLVSQGKIGFSQLGRVADSLTGFAWGVAAAAVGMGLSYLTHYSMIAVEGSKTLSLQQPFVQPGPTTKWWARVRLALHTLAIFAGIASLILFLIRMCDVKTAISSFK